MKNSKVTSELMYYPDNSEVVFMDKEGNMTPVKRVSIALYKGREVVTIEE